MQTCMTLVDGRYVTKYFIKGVEVDKDGKPKENSKPAASTSKRSNAKGSRGKAKGDGVRNKVRGNRGHDNDLLYLATAEAAVQESVLEHDAEGVQDTEE